MMVKIDTDSAARAERILAYLHRGSEDRDDVLRDAFLTGLLSRDVENVLRHELARDDVTFTATTVEVSPAALPPPLPPLALPAPALRVGPAVVLGPSLPPRRVAPSDNRPELVRAATARLLAALGLPPERTADLYAAALRVGTAKLDPSHRYPVSRHPELYSPPVGTARTTQ